MSRIVIVAICGAVFGLTNVITVADISSAAIGGYDPFSRGFSAHWRNMVLIAGAPGAAISCALFFVFLGGIGILSAATAVGIAGAALFGLMVGPPDSWLGGGPPIEAMVRIFWEWLIGGIGGIVGWLIEKLYLRYFRV